MRDQIPTSLFNAARSFLTEAMSLSFPVTAVITSVSSTREGFFAVVLALR
jgi:hypothetical protein